MSIVYKLAEVLSRPSPPPPGGFINNLPEAFGALDENGEVFIISYKGESYEPIRISLRVRLHNWLIAIGNRRQEQIDAH